MLQTVDVMLSQLGVKEATGKNDGVPAERYMHGDELAWCAGIVLWSNAQSDDPKFARSAAEHFRMRRVQAFIDVMKERGAFLPRTVTPQRNDCIFVDWDRDVSTPGLHMGMVDSFREFHGVVNAVEGNRGNAVEETSWLVHDERIIGYARPSLLVP